MRKRARQSAVRFSWVQFRSGLVKLVAPQPGDKLSPNRLTFLLFRKLTDTPQVKVFVETITSLSLGEVTATQVHSLGPGDYLRPHDDRFPNRQLAFILYLTPGWEERFGGQLHITHRDGLFEIQPAYNRLVVFDVTAHLEHYVTPITPSLKARGRLSFGGWLLFSVHDDTAG